MVDRLVIKYRMMSQSFGAVSSQTIMFTKEGVSTLKEQQKDLENSVTSNSYFDDRLGSFVTTFLAQRTVLRRFK